MHFLEIKDHLEALLTDMAYSSIQHIGSTSIPHLAASPTIDVAIIVKRANVRPTIDALVSKGDFIDTGDQRVEGIWRVQDPIQNPRQEIYVCEDDAVSMQNLLLLRDTLRQNETLRNEYSALKLDLASKSTDLNTYTAAKHAAIQNILQASNPPSPSAPPGSQKTIYNRFPPISTPRLLLREFLPADNIPFFQLESQDEVARYQTWPPRSLPQSTEEVTKTINSSYALPRTIFELAVTLNDAFIGRVGANVQRPTSDNTEAEAKSTAHTDLWFSFLPEVQGRGYATEAVEAFIPLLGSGLELEIECDPRNRGSWRLAERLGFKRISCVERAFECKGEWVGSLVYRKDV